MERETELENASLNPWSPNRATNTGAYLADTADYIANFPWAGLLFIIIILTILAIPILWWFGVIPEPICVVGHC